MLIRVRTNVGVWRVDGLDEKSAKVCDVLDGIAKTRPTVQYEKPLSSDPACNNPLDASAPLSLQGLGHGSMVHCRVDAATCAEAGAASASASSSSDAAKSGAGSTSGGGNTKRVVDKDGSIRLVHVEGGTTDDRGFRKGMLPLRDMKMQWTLQDFMDMDDKFVFKIKRQGGSWVGKGGCSLDGPSANDFQSYLRRFNFQRCRFAYLYGRFETDDDKAADTKKKEEETSEEEEAKKKKEEYDAMEKMREEAASGKLFSADNQGDSVEKQASKVVVEAIYEPPQEADPEAAEGFVPLDDPLEDEVEKLASLLGLRKVGWIFGHPPREKGFVMSSAEIIMAAEMQLEAAGGVEPTPFVTVKVTLGKGGNVSFEAFQVSKQCMEMVAEQALEVGPDPKSCVVNETFTAIQEGKESKTIENNFFLTLVPIVQHTSEMLVSQFPKANRDHDDRQQSHDEMKRQLSKSGKAGWTFIDLLSDFNLLLYLSKFLDAATDIPKICESVVDREKPLDEGFKLIIASMAGLDGSY